MEAYWPLYNLLGCHHNILSSSENNFYQDKNCCDYTVTFSYLEKFKNIAMEITMNIKLMIGLIVMIIAI